jgi:hypothetical protein
MLVLSVHWWPTPAGVGRVLDFNWYLLMDVILSSLGFKALPLRTGEYGLLVE